MIDVPFFLDFAIELPDNVEIENSCQVKDSVTYTGKDNKGSDDD